MDDVFLIKPQHEDWIQSHTTVPLNIPIPEELVVFVMTPDLDKQADFLPIIDTNLRDFLFNKRKELACMSLDDMFLNHQSSIEKIKSYLKALPLSTGNIITYHWSHTSSQSALLDRSCLTYNMGCLFLRQARTSQNVVQVAEHLNMAARVFEHLQTFLSSQSFVSLDTENKKSVQSGQHNIVLSWSEDETLENLSDFQTMAQYMMRLCLALQCHSSYRQMFAGMVSSSPPNVLPHNIPLVRENFMFTTCINLCKRYWLPLHYMSSEERTDKQVETDKVILPEMVRFYRHYVFAMVTCMQAIAEYHACRIVILRPDNLKKQYRLENSYPPDLYRGFLLSRLEFMTRTIKSIQKATSTRTAVSTLMGKIQKTQPIAVQEAATLTACLQVLFPLHQKMKDYNNSISHDPLPSSNVELMYVSVELPIKPDRIQKQWSYEVESTVPLHTNAVGLAVPVPSLMDKIKSAMPALPFMNTGPLPTVSGSMYPSINTSSETSMVVQSLITCSMPQWITLLHDVQSLVQKREQIKSLVPDYVLTEVAAREVAMLHMLSQREMNWNVFETLRATVVEEAVPFYQRIFG